MSVKIAVVYSSMKPGYRISETEDVDGMVRSARARGPREDATCYFQRELPEVLRKQVLVHSMYRQFSYLNWRDEYHKNIDDMQIRELIRWLDDIIKRTKEGEAALGRVVCITEHPSTVSHRQGYAVIKQVDKPLPMTENSTARRLYYNEDVPFNLAFGCVLDKVEARLGRTLSRHSPYDHPMQSNSLHFGADEAQSVTQYVRRAIAYAKRKERQS